MKISILKSIFTPLVFTALTLSSVSTFAGSGGTDDDPKPEVVKPGNINDKATKAALVFLSRIRFWQSASSYGGLFGGGSAYLLTQFAFPKAFIANLSQPVSLWAATVLTSGIAGFVIASHMTQFEIYRNPNRIRHPNWMGLLYGASTGLASSPLVPAVCAVVIRGLNYALTL
jgi:hypothetical protein